MILTPRQSLKRNFEKIGPLTDAQFLATKSLSKKLIYAKQVDLKNVLLIDIDGLESNVDMRAIVAEYNRGNVGGIKLQATVRGMSGGPEQTGSLRLDNIIDLKFDQSIGLLVVENDKCVFTNLPCWTEISDLAKVIQDPYNWVDKEALAELLPFDATLEDFVSVRDEREIDRDIVLGFL